MSTTDGRKMLLGVKNVYNIKNVQDAFDVAEEYGDGKIHKVDKVFATSLAKYYYIYYIVMNDVSKIQEYISQPWNLSPPNSSPTSTLGLLDGGTIDSDSSVLSIATKSIFPAFENPILFNKSGTKYTDYISQTQFDNNDFQTTKINASGKTSPLLFLVSSKDNVNKKTFLGGVENTGKIDDVYIMVEPTTQFFTRCCASLNIKNTTSDTAGNADFCPTGYKGDRDACDNLMTGYCTKSDSKTYLKPVCGCYPDYIQEQIIDKDPSIEKMLKELGITQLASGCYTSCSDNNAYTAHRENCNVVICKSEINNSGVINADSFSNDQNCTSSTINENGGGSGGGSGGEGSGGEGNGNGSGEGNGNGGGGSGGEENNKKVIYGLVIGGSVLLLLILLILVIAM